MPVDSAARSCAGFVIRLTAIVRLVRARPKIIDPLSCSDLSQTSSTARLRALRQRLRNFSISLGEPPTIVIPAQAGIQQVPDILDILDPRLRGGDVGLLWLPGVIEKLPVMHPTGGNVLAEC